MAAFNLNNAKKYQIYMRKAFLYKNNEETELDVNLFSIGCSGDSVRIGCKDDTVAGSMVCMVFDIYHI